MDPVPELENIREQTDANSERFRELCYGLDESQLKWRPQPNSWCIAEVLLHLEKTTRVFLPPIDEAIENARRNGRLSTGPFRLGRMGKFYVWYVERRPEFVYQRRKSCGLRSKELLWMRCPDFYNRRK